MTSTKTRNPWEGSNRTRNGGDESEFVRFEVHDGSVPGPGQVDCFVASNP